MAEDSEDDWENDWENDEDVGVKLAAELAKAKVTETTTKDESGDNNEDDDWLTDAPAPAPAPTKTPVKPVDDKPMFLVDFTLFSDGAVHNKFDKHAVNDPDLKKQFTQQVTKDLEDKSKLAELVSKGVVHPCGSSVWRDAIVTLRDAHEGHYFGPVFP